MSSNNFCPLIREQCKRQGCMFWSEKAEKIMGEEAEKGDCSLNLFAKAVGRAIISIIGTEREGLSPLETSGLTDPRREITQLQQTEDELASELVDFIKKEFPEQESERYLPHTVTRLFWAQKGIDSILFDLHDPNYAVTHLKMEKAERIALERLSQERLLKEKEMLPEIVEKCIQWARKQGLKKVTKSNISFFLSECELKVSQTIKDILYNKVNFELSKNLKKQSKLAY